MSRVYYEILTLFSICMEILLLRLTKIDQVRDQAADPSSAV